MSMIRFCQPQLESSRFRVVNVSITSEVTQNTAET